MKPKIVKGAKKPQKYRNHKITVNGMTFDSKAEYRYYLKLQQLQASGEVESFEHQKTFLLFDGFRKNGKKYQDITYKADFFVTYANGEQVVIDVKGQDKVTAEFAIKFKLFHARYPYRLVLARYNYKTNKFTEKE